jgi:hypothetical protein
LVGNIPTERALEALALRGEYAGLKTGNFPIRMSAEISRQHGEKKIIQ